MSAPVIDESAVFPIEISRGAVGGHQFAVAIIETRNGAEQRVLMNENGRLRLNVTQGSRTPEQAADLTAFWLARFGPTRGFRVRHWHDYKLTDEPQTLTGAPTFQLIKTYTFGAVSYVRDIYKIDETEISVSAERNNSPFAGFTFDADTGIFTLTADITKAVTNITQAVTPTVTTSTAHGFSIGDIVYFSGVVGMTQINGQVAEVLSTPTGFTFTIDLDTTGFDAYTSGGTVAKYVQPSEELTISCYFHVPMRFDTEAQMMIETDSLIRDWENIPLVEVRHGVAVT
jgi:uncharacterized protein (TIGR02217 family)